MNNIETGYKCRMIKEWSFEKKLKGKAFNLKVVNDISGKIQRNWVLTEKQHQAIDNIYNKFRINTWCNKKNMRRQNDSDSDSESDNDTDDDRIFTHKRDMRDMYYNPNRK